MASTILRLVLTYDPTTSTLIGRLYNQDNIPNSEAPDPVGVVATYFIYRNNVLIAEVGDIGDTLFFDIPPPTCGTNYRVVVIFSINGVPQPASTSNITIGPNYIIGGSLLSQRPIGEGLVNVRLARLPGVTPTNIVWANNYELFNPVNPFSVFATNNGIYEVAFQSVETGYAYYSAIEVTNSLPAMYLKIVGNDGNIYGTFGTPTNVSDLFFVPVNGTAPYRYRIYVNGQQVSNNSFLPLAGLSAGDLIYVYVTDCCGIVLEADTFILPCGLLSSNIRVKTNKSNKSIKSNNFNSNFILLPYPRPTKGRPRRLPKPPQPKNRRR